MKKVEIMNKLITIFVVIAIVIVITTSVITFPVQPSESQSHSIYDSGFTYYDIELIQKTLSEHNVIVSAPTAITDHTTSQYCTFFEKGLPRTVDYCTTTAITFEGNPLGNINMGGDTTSPIMAVANIETSTLESNQEEVNAIIETMIETLVCDCWEEVKSDGDIESIAAWVSAVHTFYYDSGERGIKSQVDDLGPAVITLEITPKENSILQTLIIVK